MSTTERRRTTSRTERMPLGSVTVPVSFADQIITSLLFNHDSNPVHHKPEHAVQWVMGLLAGAAMAGEDSRLADATPEERTYALGSLLLQSRDVVVMPGVILSAICFERFIPPEEHVVSVTNTFTYPLMVPTSGHVDVEIQAFELRGEGADDPDVGRARHVLIEAHGPGLNNTPAKLLKLEAVLYPAGTKPDAVYEKVVKKEFERLDEKATAAPEMPSLSHPAAISDEDRRRYTRIVGFDRRITPLSWQAKITRVLTEIIDHLKDHKAYQKEVREYYAGRSDEEERRKAIAAYVAKEVKYRVTQPLDTVARIEELAALTQQLYVRQHTVFDPRLFVQDGLATKAHKQMHLDLHLYETRLRRGIHRFYTGARVGDQTVFRGEAMVTGQPLVTRELANFLCEVNHNFENLRLFAYQGKG